MAQIVLTHPCGGGTMEATTPRPQQPGTVTGLTVALSRARTTGRPAAPRLLLMKFATDPKETTMKTALTCSYVRLVAVVAVAAPIAAMFGSYGHA
jgi:hypothetical protein